MNFAVLPISDALGSRSYFVTIEGARRILSASGKNLLEDFSIIDSGTHDAEQSLASLALSSASSAAAASSSTTMSSIVAERHGGALTALTFVVFAYPQTAVRLCTLEPFTLAGGGDSGASKQKKKKKRKGKSKRATTACGFSEAELATIRIASDVQEFVPTEVHYHARQSFAAKQYTDYFDIVIHFRLDTFRRASNIFLL